MGIHGIDTIRYILGDPNPISVYARIGTYFGNHSVEDTASLIIEWEGGISTIIESGWWQPHMEAPEAAVRLWGTKGFLSVFPTRIKTKIANEFGDFIPHFPTRPEHCGQHLYNAQIEYFLKLITTGTMQNTGPDKGIVAMRIIESAYKSAVNGKVVNIRAN